MQSKDANSSTDKRAWVEFILYVVVGFGLFTLATFALGTYLFPEDSESVFITLALALTSLVCLGGTAYFLGLYRRKITPADLGLRPLRWEWWWLPAAAGIALGLFPLRAALGLVVQLLLEGNLESVAARGEFILRAGAGMEGFVLTLLGVGLLAPIAEELYFRGLLHTWLQRHMEPYWGRILLSSALFGLAHFDSLGVVAASFVIGIVMAIAYERTRSILFPIVMHVVTNSVAVVLLYVALAIQEWVPLGP